MEDNGREDMAGKAQHIWTMLEDMANSDPAAYRKFIDKHIKEGKEVMALPEPHMCVQTSYQKGNKKKTILYINICEWKRIPAPKSNLDPIPIIGGTIYSVEAGVQAIGVAFNPNVLKECGRDAAMQEEQGLMISLCLDYIDNQYNLQVTRSYSVLPHKVTHMGTLTDLKNCLLSKTKGEEKQVESELEKAFGSTMKDSILSELSNISVDSEVPSPIGRGVNEKSQVQTRTGSTKGIQISQPEKLANKHLIAEIRPKVESCESLDKLPKPDYNLMVKDAAGTRPHRLLLRIKLPDVSSVAECELDITMDDVHLVVTDQYDLTVALPERVDCDTASAKFNTKTGTLSITLPTTS